MDRAGAMSRRGLTPMEKDGRSFVSNPRPVGSYKELVAKTQVPPPPQRTAERALDNLLQALEDRERAPKNATKLVAPDPIAMLRELVVNELVPTFVELVEKYARPGVSLQMDASSLLEGGREMRFEFGVGEFRSQLQGTVTADAIAFHEVRFAPDIDGQLAAGPMLRLKQLNAKTFREFICERLSILIRSAARRK